MERESDTKYSSHQLNTITYGTASAPYHAMRCLCEFAALYRDKYPVAKAIKEDFFMDDVFSEGRTLQIVIEI